MLFLKYQNETIAFPYTVGQLKIDNPDISFPVDPDQETLSQFGVHPVHSLDQPEVDAKTHTAERKQLPELVDGQWVLGWNVRAKTNEEIASETASVSERERKRRDAKLSACDWTQLDDTPLSNAQKIAWASYRQALRDLPSSPGFPLDIDWPVAPDQGEA